MVAQLKHKATTDFHLSSNIDHKPKCFNINVVFKVLRTSGSSKEKIQKATVQKKKRNS